MHKTFVTIGMYMLIAVLVLKIIINGHQLKFHKDLIALKDIEIGKCIEQTMISIQNTKDCQKYFRVRVKDGHDTGTARSAN